MVRNSRQRRGVLNNGGRERRARVIKKGRPASGGSGYESEAVANSRENLYKLRKIPIFLASIINNAP